MRKAALAAVKREHCIDFVLAYEGGAAFHDAGATRMPDDMYGPELKVRNPDLGSAGRGHCGFHTNGGGASMSARTVWRSSYRLSSYIMRTG